MAQANFRKGKVTEELFKVVKTLLESGNTAAETARFMKMSAGTVANIRNAETYAEYKNIAYQQARAIKAKGTAAKETAESKPEPAQVVEHRQTVTVQATHYMMTEMQKTNELLTLISRKLAFIVDELTGTKTETKEG